jgi:hypothetical protein
MKQKALEKMAAQDAYDYGFAQMFFGDGAGVMRRHLDAKVGDRIRDIPGYEMAFEVAHGKLNQTELAEKALAHRKALDRTAKVSQNMRAFKSGKFQNLTTGVALVVVLGVAAHTTGLDVIAYEESKRLYRKAKTEIKFRRARAKGLNVEKLYG